MKNLNETSRDLTIYHLIKKKEKHRCIIDLYYLGQIQCVARDTAT